MIDRACNSEANGAKNKTWLSYANAIKGKGFIFDYVGLIKGILWGWSADLSKNYGGAGYACNDVPDIGADSMIAKCPGASTDFSNTVSGALESVLVGRCYRGGFIYGFIWIMIA